MQKLHKCYTPLVLIDAEAIRKYFSKLGLEPEIADIYLSLHSHGPQTISELSRSARVERTRIYRLIDDLLASNLIEIESHYKRGIIKAAPISNLQILINQKEQEVKSLHEELGLIQQVLARTSLSSPATRVQFYHGPEGVRQILWNETKSKTDVLSINDEPVNEALGKAFTLRWTEEINRNNVRLRLVESPHFNEVNLAWYQKENLTELVPNHESHLIRPEIFPITTNMDTWDNVVAYFDWKNGEIFGFEIYNQNIADMHRQLFQLLWAQSEPKTSLSTTS